MAAKQLTGAFAPDGSKYVTLTDGAGNLTGSGTVSFNNISLPDTTAAGATGVISFGGARFIHDTNASSNVFIGHNAGNLTTTTVQTTCVGESSGLALTNGGSNTLIGRFAGGGITTGANNVAIGVSTLAAGANGCIQCTAIGFSALGSCTGNTNTAVGYTAGGDVVGGTGNSFLGRNTGRGIVTGSNNTVLGDGVSGLASGLTGSIILAIGGGTIKADYGNTTAGSWTFVGPVVIPSFTVASLPASPGTGAIALVTDQLTTVAAKGVAPTGGGAVKEVVVYTGAGWVSI